MERFEGFTDEDIKHLTASRSTNFDLKQSKTISTSAVYKQQQNRNNHRNRLSRKNVAREKLLKGHAFHFNNEALPREARLHIHQIPEEEEEDNVVETVQSKNNRGSLHEREQNEEKKQQIEKTVPLKCAEIKQTPIKEKLGDSVEKKTPHPVLNSENANEDVLEAFETRQRVMEEENRQRKEILKRALADRAKRTNEEVKRLNEIEGELKKLDLLLSNDVSIIRNQIEAASIDFMDAQKRYDKAEREFLDAKLELFNKKERKELLTSHLCTIIEQNEMRKAKKLSDLMAQLEIGPKVSLITSQITVEYKEKGQAQTEQQQQSNTDEGQNNKSENANVNEGVEANHQMNGQPPSTTCPADQ